MEHVSIPGVPAASIVGMAITLLISVGLPIALCVIVWRKTRARISSFFIGAAAFVVFAMILEQLMHVVVLKISGTALTGNIWLYALYGGLAAGVFEESGRYLAMRLCMKKSLNRQNAIMYGVGHGGIEAMLIVGITYLNNLLIAAMINGGQSALLLSPLSGVDGAVYQQTLAQLTALGATPSWQFYMAGLERISAIVFHISASYLVYLAVSRKKPGWYLLAILLHFLLDAIAVIANVYLPILATEMLLLLFSGVLGCLVWRMDKRCGNEE